MRIKVKYPYRACAPVNHTLLSWDLMPRDAQKVILSRCTREYDVILDLLQHTFDVAHGIPVRDGHLDDRVVERKSSTPGVVGGLLEKNEPPSYVNKNNYNPPTSNLQKVNESLFGSGLAKDYENSPPVPITLPLLRFWAAAQSPDPSWKRKDGSDWAPPKCTVGILRRRDNGKISGWVPCNGWSCETCGPIKRDRLSKKATDAFGDQEVHFLTLNLRVPKGKQKVTDSNPMMSEGYRIQGYVPQEDIARCFQRFRSILHKKGYFTGATGEITRVTHYTNKFGTECTRTTRARKRTDQAYFYVKEFSPPSHVKNGVVTAGHRRHYHVLTNFAIPEDVVRDAWWYATNKTSTNVKMIDETDEHGKLRPSYITKYINKSMSNDTFVADYLPHERRYGKSVGFFTMAFPSLGLCFFQPLVSSARAYDEAVHEPDKLPKHFSHQHLLA